MAHGVTVFVNPASGNGQGAKLFERLKEQAAADRTIAENISSLQHTPRRGEEKAVEGAVKNARAILICGGDGTVHQFVNLILRTGSTARLAVCALGTGNDFCLSLGTGRGDVVAHLKKIIASPRTVAVDIFSVNREIYFVNYISWGLDAHILSLYERSLPKFERLNYDPKLSKKTFFFMLGLIGLLSYRAKVAVDGKDYSSIIVSNLRTYAGGSVIGKASRPDDGTLEMARLANKWQFLKLVMSRFSAALAPKSEPAFPPLSLEIPPGTPVQVDGEDYTEFFRNTGSFTIARAGSLTVCI